MINVPRVNAPQIDPNMALKIQAPTIDISPAMNAYFNARKMKNQEKQAIIDNKRNEEIDIQRNEIFEAGKSTRELQDTQANIAKESIEKDYEKSFYEEVLTDILPQIKANGINEETMKIIASKEIKLQKNLGEDYQSKAPDFMKFKSTLMETQGNPMAIDAVVDSYGKSLDIIKSTKSLTGLVFDKDLSYIGENGDQAANLIYDENGMLQGARILGGPVISKEKVNEGKVNSSDQFKFNEASLAKIDQTNKEVAIIDAKSKDKIDNAEETAMKTALGTKAAATVDTIREDSLKFNGTGKLDNILEILSKGKVGTGGLKEMYLGFQNFFGMEGNMEEGSLKRDLDKAILAQLKTIFGAAFTAKEGDKLDKIEAAFNKGPDVLRSLVIDLRKEGINSIGNDIKFLDSKKDIIGDSKAEIDNLAVNLGVSSEKLFQLSKKKGGLYKNLIEFREESGEDTSLFNQKLTNTQYRNLKQSKNIVPSAESVGYVAPPELQAIFDKNNKARSLK